MPRWTAITSDDLKAAGLSIIVDRASSVLAGSVEPVAEAIANVVAEVRNAVRAGNRLDTDETKIPGSLKRLAVRLVLYSLLERIGMPLDDDQKKQASADQKQMERLYGRKLVVEPADDPETTAGPVNAGTWNSENKLIPRGHPIPRPGLQQGAMPGQYANPDAPEDNTAS